MNGAVCGQKRAQSIETAVRAEEIAHETVGVRGVK
jgi:hypothetical protein